MIADDRMAQRRSIRKHTRRIGDESELAVIVVAMRSARNGFELSEIRLFDLDIVVVAIVREVNLMPVFGADDVLFFQIMREGRDKTKKIHHGHEGCRPSILIRMSANVVHHSRSCRLVNPTILDNSSQALKTRTAHAEICINKTLANANRLRFSIQCFGLSRRFGLIPCGLRPSALGQRSPPAGRFSAGYGPQITFTGMGFESSIENSAWRHPSQRAEDAVGRAACASNIACDRANLEFGQRSADVDVRVPSQIVVHNRITAFRKLQRGFFDKLIHHRTTGSAMIETGREKYEVDLYILAADEVHQPTREAISQVVDLGLMPRDLTRPDRALESTEDV